MMAAARNLSEFGQAIDSAFRERDVLVGQPAKRRRIIEDVEGSGMSADEFRLVVRWWDRQTGCQTPGLLFDVLGDEVNWRDVVESERPRRDREVSRAAEAAHYPGFDGGSGYDPNPLTRDMGRTPPFSNRDALDAYRAGYGRNLLGLACHLGWTDAEQIMQAQLDGKLPPGLLHLRAVLRDAGIDPDKDTGKAKKVAETKAQAAQRRKRDERHEKAAALFRIKANRARRGDAELVAGWDPQSEVEA